MDKTYALHLSSMRKFLVFFFLVWASFLKAQNTVVGYVLSAEDSLPLEGAFVLLNEEFAAYADQNGRFEINWMGQPPQALGWHIRHLGYQVLQKKDVGEISEIRKFYLTSETYLENVLKVTTGPKVVLGSEQWNIGDFCWDLEGDMIVLTYQDEDRWKPQALSKKTLFRGGKLLRLDRGKVALIDIEPDQAAFQQIEIPGIVLGFYDQFPGEIIIEGLENYFLLHHNLTEWDLIPLPDSVMKKNIQPVVDTLGNQQYVISDYEPSYPAFGYFIERDGNWNAFHHIQDEKEMELFRSEYKYLGPKEKVEAYQFELDHGIDKEVVAAYMRGFQNTHYHQPLYAPLVILSDTMMVFDHVHHEVSFFSKKGENLGKKEIQYHQLKDFGKWMGKVWKDSVTKRIYTSYKKAGKVSLIEIFPSQQRVELKMQLTHPYVEKIKIRGGEIYYIYKPFESTKKRYLYKERIP